MQISDTKYYLVAFLCFLCTCNTLNAKQILSNLKLQEGKWEVVGVKLYNHKPVPLQNELGTFVIDNQEVIQQIAQTWDFAPHYDDYCDFHYALKFYQNKRLIRTLKINLICNYVTDDVLSYRFNSALLSALKPHMRRIPWSRATYTDLDRLRESVKKLHKAADVWLYHDVMPYQFNGYFVTGVDGLAWHVNRDSVLASVRRDLAAATGTKDSTDFYVVPHIFFMQENYTLSFRYFVYCNESVAQRFSSQNPKAVTASWRDHFAFADPEDREVQLIVIGVNKERYFAIMKGEDN